MSESTTDLLKQIRNKHSHNTSSLSNSINKSIIYTPPIPQPEIITTTQVSSTPPTLTTMTISSPPTTTSPIETTTSQQQPLPLPAESTLSQAPSAPLSLDQLLLDLKIIASVKEYDKLAINDANKQLTIDKPYMLQGVLRYLYGQGREQALDYIEHIINGIFIITDELLETSPSNTAIKFADDTKSIYQNIVHHLTSSISGLQNLKITYMKDIPCISRIQLIIEKIQNRIQKINNLMKLS
jgi:hypothetical protein